MKKLIYPVFIVLFVLSFTKISFAQDDNMKKMMDYMTPGEQQKQMEKAVGTWKTHAKFWMSPGSKSAETDGTATAEMILGGRYLVTKQTSSMMGMTYEGMSLDGYDNAAKIYNSVWVDNMGTGIMTMTGKWIEDRKLIEYTGKMVDPVTGGTTDVRSTLQVKDDGSMYMEMFGMDKGKEYKLMEKTMTKQ
jgi:hypothetical protein